MKAFLYSLGIRFYPMFFLNGIFLGKWTNGYTKLRVYIVRQPLNTNGAFSVFGGSIASAADPFLPLMFRLVTMEKNMKVSVWTKSVAVKFIKPVNKLVYFDYEITGDEIHSTIEILNKKGKHVHVNHVNCVDRNQTIYATAEVHTYMKLHV